MKFEWDEDKNAANVEKHKISFETAKRIFDGPIFSVIDDRFDYGEVRRNSIGLIEDVLFLMVTHTDRSGVTRIISARPAKRKERERYAEEIRKRAEH